MTTVVIWNGSAALVNVTLYLFSKNPICLGCAVFSGSMALAFYLYPMGILQ